MARTRTTKKLAQRIDLNYFKRPTPFKRAKLYLSVLLPLLALIWIVERTIVRDHRVYSSGRLSAAHAVLEKECSACHIPQAGVVSAKASDAGCQSCHDGPVHHETAGRTPACATCHTEHRGRINISAATNQNCAECHSDLRSFHGSGKFASNIKSLQDGHPEFAVLRTANKPPTDPGTIKLNHHLHMQQIRRGPNGPLVQLDCASCHHAAILAGDLTYSDPQYTSATTSYKLADEALPIPADTSTPPRPMSGRERMAPVKFANACASCHLLTFDKRFDDGVPHDQPEVVHAFLTKKFRDYIAVHPNDLREMQDPDRALSGKPQTPAMQTLTPFQWIAQHTAVAEELLWKKTCAQCHTVTGATLQETKIGRWSPKNESSNQRIPNSGYTSESVLPSGPSLPEIARSHTTVQWFPHAKFDHDAHRGFSCVGCHEKALKSTESSDILVPGIANCQTCHAPGPGYAESRCSECHTYHDWTKRKEITPQFTLPALPSRAH
ncbi:MAG TPA: hypothetical protein VK525_20295 [Candidatus Saccharimonadales bacterium]|nr:hypothetical protein [Candidatus Saccharimonadales bacterium]